MYYDQEHGGSWPRGTLYLSTGKYISGIQDGDYYDNRELFNIVYDDVLTNNISIYTAVNSNQLTSIDIGNFLGVDFFDNSYTAFAYSSLLSKVVIGMPVRIYFGDSSWSRQDFRLIASGITDSINASTLSNINISISNAGKKLSQTFQLNNIEEYIFWLFNINPIALYAGQSVYTNKEVFFGSVSEPGDNPWWYNFATKIPNLEVTLPNLYGSVINILPLSLLSIYGIYLYDSPLIRSRSREGNNDYKFILSNTTINSLPKRTWVHQVRLGSNSIVPGKIYCNTNTAINYTNATYPTHNIQLANSVNVSTCSRITETGIPGGSSSPGSVVITLSNSTTNDPFNLGTEGISLGAIKFINSTTLAPILVGYFSYSETFAGSGVFELKLTDVLDLFDKICPPVVELVAGTLVVLGDYVALEEYGILIVGTGNLATPLMDVTKIDSNMLKLSHPVDCAKDILYDAGLYSNADDTNISNCKSNINSHLVSKYSQANAMAGIYINSSRDVNSSISEILSSYSCTLMSNATGSYSMYYLPYKLVTSGLQEDGLIYLSDILNISISSIEPPLPEIKLYYNLNNSPLGNSNIGSYSSQDILSIDDADVLYFDGRYCINTHNLSKAQVAKIYLDTLHQQYQEYTEVIDPALNVDLYQERPFISTHIVDNTITKNNISAIANARKDIRKETRYIIKVTVAMKLSSIKVGDLVYLDKYFNRLFNTSDPTKGKKLIVVSCKVIYSESIIELELWG
jgi:hypothetical protein